MRKPTRIGELTALPQNQKDLLEEWLETTTPYPQIAQRVLDEFGVQTNVGQLKRMRRHLAAKRLSREAAENLETIGELMDEGALANIEYKPVTLKLVEKRLFEHALDPKTDTKVLKNLYTILDQHERRQLESRRLDLREREIILKEPPLPRTKDPTEVHEKRWDEWGMPQANRAFFRKEILDEMARQQAIRNLGHNPNPAHKIPSASQVAGKGEAQAEQPISLSRHCEGESSSPASTTNVQPEQRPTLNSSSPSLEQALPRPESVNPPSEPGGLNLDKPGVESARPPVDKAIRQHPDGVPQSALQQTSASVDPQTESLEIASIPSPSSALDQSSITNLKSKIQNSLAYTHARAEEYCAYRRSITPWPYRQNPPRYKTQLIQCPCGSRLPCPNHEEFTDSFWFFSPFSPDYAQALLHRNLPIPENLLQQYCA